LINHDRADDTGNRGVKVDAEPAQKAGEDASAPSKIAAWPRLWVSALSGARLLQLLLLAVAAWGVTFARFTLGPLQEAIRLDLGLSDNQIAWLQGPAVAVPMALGAIPLGLVADRYSRANLFLIFAISTLLATVIASFASNLVLLIGSRCLIGLGIAATLVAAYSMVGDLYPPEQRGRAAMVVAMGEIGGAPAAFALGGFLLTIAGTDPAAWRWVLFRMSATLLPVVFLMLAIREPRRSGVEAKPLPLADVWLELRRHGGVVSALLLARITVWTADGAVLVWAAPSFARRFAIQPDRIGAIMASALLISGLLGPVLGGLLADYCQRSGGPRRTVIALSVLALISAPAALFAIAPTVSVAAILLASFLTLGYTIGTAAVTLITIVIPRELRGFFLAITITVGALFFIGVAPVLVSGLSSVLGGPGMIGNALALVCGVASLLGATVLMLGSGNFIRSSPQNAGRSL
jgi:MFS family permease